MRTTSLRTAVRELHQSVPFSHFTEYLPFCRVDCAKICSTVLSLKSSFVLTKTVNTYLFSRTYRWLTFHFRDVEFIPLTKKTRIQMFLQNLSYTKVTQESFFRPHFHDSVWFFVIIPWVPSSGYACSTCDWDGIQNEGSPVVDQSNRISFRFF